MEVSLSNDKEGDGSGLGAVIAAAADNDDVDESSSMDDPSTTNSSGTGPSDCKKESEPELAQEETKAVNRSKWLVYGVLLIAAVSVGTYLFTFLRDEEEKDFETKVSKYTSADSRPHSRFAHKCGLCPSAVGGHLASDH